MDEQFEENREEQEFYAPYEADDYDYDDEVDDAYEM